jgi:hypothetical protein
MTELTEIRFNDNNIQLMDHHVKGPILPARLAELDRTITIQGNTIVEGAVHAKKLEIRNGDTYIHGAVYAQQELYVNSEAAGEISFRKAVGSAHSITSRASDVTLTFESDVNAKHVTLYNAFVAGSVYGDEVVLQNCVVIGGVFATQSLDITQTIVGTFHAPTVKAAQVIWLLLPSAFSIERIFALPDTRMYNLSLADLGSLYKGLPQSSGSGMIELNLELDQVRTTLNSNETQKTIRSYSVVGKVLAADLLDIEKFQNHFLLTAASLGTQLLRGFDLGVDADDKIVPLSIERIRVFFFDILNGKYVLQEINGSFDISEITARFVPVSPEVMVNPILDEPESNNLPPIMTAPGPQVTVPPPLNQKPSAEDDEDADDEVNGKDGSQLPPTMPPPLPG